MAGLGRGVEWLVREMGRVAGSGSGVHSADHNQFFVCIVVLCFMAQKQIKRKETLPSARWVCFVIAVDKSGFRKVSILGGVWFICLYFCHHGEFCYFT